MYILVTFQQPEFDIVSAYINIKPSNYVKDLILTISSKFYILCNLDLCGLYYYVPPDGMWLEKDSQLSYYKLNSKSKIEFRIKNASLMRPLHFNFEKETVIKEGWLLKMRPKNVVKAWKKRYFVLKENSLLYYEDDDKNKDKFIRQQNMDGCSLGGDIMPMADRYYCIKIMANNAREFVLSADSKEDIIEWQRAFLYLFDRLNENLIKSIVPNSHDEILLHKKGWLQKKSPHVIQGWTNRYFMLTNQALSYFKEGKDALIYCDSKRLCGADVRKEDKNNKNILIMTEENGDEMFLSSESTESQLIIEQWRAAIENAIDIANITIQYGDLESV